jgi:hypothetical protein
MPNSALNSLLRQGPPPTPAGGPRLGSAVPDMPQGPVGPAPATAPPPGAGGNPLAGLLQGGGAPAQRPAPTHTQTVAALTHLQAVQRTMAKLSRLPGIGKQNIRPDIFDATADLMGRAMLTLPQVMNELKNIPADPPGQKQWVLQHLNDVMEAQHQILNDHAQAFPGSGDFATEMANLPPQVAPQSHIEMMGDVANHYVGKRR